MNQPPSPQGPNENALDEIDRSVHDALCAVSRALEKNAVCAGGGAVETALAIYLEDFARTLVSGQLPALLLFLPLGVPDDCRSVVEKHRVVVFITVLLPRTSLSPPSARTWEVDDRWTDAS